MCHRCCRCLSIFLFCSAALLFCGSVHAQKTKSAAPGAALAAGGAAAGGAGGGSGGAAASTTAAASSPTAGTPTSPYVLSFDGKSANVQGVPFDVPVQLQFFFTDKIDIKKIGYFEVSNRIFRRFLNGKYDSVNAYFQAAVENATKAYYIAVTSIDTFRPNPDPTGLKYMLTLTTPVYLRANRHYVFGYKAGITSNEFFPLLNRSLVAFIQAHEARKSGPIDALEQKLLDDWKQYVADNPRAALLDSLEGKIKMYKNYIKDTRIKRPPFANKKTWKDYKRSLKASGSSATQQLDDLTRRKVAKAANVAEQTAQNMRYKQMVKDWENIYHSGFSGTDPADSPSVNRFHTATTLYDQTFTNMSKKYSLANIPYNSYDPESTDFAYLKDSDYTKPGVYIKEIYRFFSVYHLALGLDTEYVSFKGTVQSVPTLTSQLNALGKGDCMKALVTSLTVCAACRGNANIDCAILKDSTGLLNFLIGKVQADDKNPFQQYYAALPKKLLDPDFLAKDNAGLDTLALTEQYLVSLKNLLLLNRTTDNTLACDDSMLTGLKALINALDDVLAKIKKAKADYLKRIAADKNFSQAVLFSGDSYTYSLATRQAYKLTADIGVINYGVNSVWKKTYGNNWNRITPYFGLHYNFHYVNSDLPFSSMPHPFLSRLSAFLGITILSVQQSGEFKNLFGSSALLAGGAVRLTSDGFRVVFGSMLVKKDNPNPLITTTTVGILPFVGVSYDFNTIFSNMVSLIK